MGEQLARRPLSQRVVFQFWEQLGHGRFQIKDTRAMEMHQGIGGGSDLGDGSQIIQRS